MKEIDKIKRKQNDLLDKVFVHVTIEEVFRHGTVYRIVKFNRIRTNQTLCRLLLNKNPKLAKTDQ
jgi:hypothetical protein